MIVFDFSPGWRWTSSTGWCCRVPSPITYRRSEATTSSRGASTPWRSSCRRCRTSWRPVRTSLRITPPCYSTSSASSSTPPWPSTSCSNSTTSTSTSTWRQVRALEIECSCQLARSARKMSVEEYWYQVINIYVAWGTCQWNMCQLARSTRKVSVEECSRQLIRGVRNLSVEYLCQLLRSVRYAS